MWPFVQCSCSWAERFFFINIMSQLEYDTRPPVLRSVLKLTSCFWHPLESIQYKNRYQMFKCPFSLSHLHVQHCQRIYITTNANQQCAFHQKQCLQFQFNVHPQLHNIFSIRIIFKKLC